MIFVGNLSLQNLLDGTKTTKIKKRADWSSLSQLWDSNPRPSRYECDALPTKLNWQRISFL